MLHINDLFVFHPFKLTTDSGLPVFFPHAHSLHKKLCHFCWQAGHAMSQWPWKSRFPNVEHYQYMFMTNNWWSWGDAAWLEQIDFISHCSWHINKFLLFDTIIPLPSFYWSWYYCWKNEVMRTWFLCNRWIHGTSQIQWSILLLHWEILPALAAAVTSHTGHSMYLGWRQVFKLLVDYAPWVCKLGVVTTVVERSCIRTCQSGLTPQQKSEKQLCWLIRTEWANSALDWHTSKTRSSSMGPPDFNSQNESTWLPWSL